ncbi:hypothetical protein CLIB1423_01S01266 [[Candida] railenensis]|uniref:Uncharacterized protein n=1 Tax=[Candida] railenensis TaxID=45579 RepID=A0A9P0QJZ1_9ASCO|nr:hypothetical protein CLIB1423_01S01266 [[Candida] railenensis]
MPFKFTLTFRKSKMNEDSTTSTELKSRNIFKRIRRYYRNKKEKESFDQERLELIMSLDDEINWIHENNMKEVDQYEVFEENILETSSVIEQPQEEDLQEKENFWRQKPKKEPIVKIASNYLVKQFPRNNYEKLNPYHENETKQSTEDFPKELKSILKKPKPITLKSFKTSSITPLSTYSNLSLNANNNSNSLLNTPTSSIQPSQNSNMLSCGKPASSLELSKYSMHSSGSTLKCMSEKEIKKLTKKNTKMNKSKY